MREAYRLQKQPLQSFLTERNKKLSVFFIYTGKEIPPYELIYEKTGIAIRMLIEKITSEKTHYGTPDQHRGKDA